MKNIYLIISGFSSAILFGLLGLLVFAGYGAGDCDMPGKTCDCFCCSMFGLRGYEACGDFGLIVGVIFGLALVWFSVTMYKKRQKAHKH